MSDAKPQRCDRIRCAARGFDRRAALVAVSSAAMAAAMRCPPSGRAESATASRLARDYDGYSETYDGLETGQIAKAFGLSDFRSRAVSQASGRTLEIGIGTGINLPLYEFGAGKVDAVVGVDISKGMLRESRTKVQALNLEDRVELVQGDATSLPFDDSSFDSVVITYSMCVFPDAPGSLAEVARVLKPGGHAYLAEQIASDVAPLALYQRLLSPLIVRFGKGCDWSKPLPDLVREAGGLELRGVTRAVGGTVALIDAVRAAPL